MAFDPHELDRDYGAPSGVITEEQYTTRTFLWMMLGLMITFGVAILGWMTNLTQYLYAASPLVPIALGLVTLFMVITFSGRIEKMSVSSAQTLFVVFSIVMGITVSSWLYLFQLLSVVLIFLMTRLYLACWPLMATLPAAVWPDIVPSCSAGSFSCWYSRFWLRLSPACPEWRVCTASSASPSSWAIPPMTLSASGNSITTTPAILT